MNNPFSNRTTTTSGEYLQKKKAITKIEYIKRMPWRNFKTRDYIVKANVRQTKHYEKPKYPEEPPSFSLTKYNISHKLSNCNIYN